MKHLPVVRIHYCSQCNWLLRAGWMAQELLSTFAEELESVELKPGTGGIFQIHVLQAGEPDICIWDRKSDDGFPEIVELKRRVRDRACPDKPLGHIDQHKQG